MYLLAPAKINLHLRVGRRRDDGFHPLLSWMVTVGLFDSLTLEAVPPAEPLGRPGGFGAAPPASSIESTIESLIETGGGVELVICGDGDRPDLPRDGQNLVVRIATAFLNELRRERLSGRSSSDRQIERPAFREEGYPGPDPPTPARAAAAGGKGPTASAGAAQTTAPGTVREDPAGTEDGHTLGGMTADGPAGVGAGAVRGAERSGRSNRRDAEGVEEDARRAPAGAAPGEQPGAVPDGIPGVTRDALASGAARGATRFPPDAARPGAARPATAGAAARLRIELDKRVPIGAGLGGGSSDAAHTLVALDRMLATKWAAEQLSAFAARFGSDTPFFVAAALGRASCACRGRGEVVRPVARPARARRAVIFSPPFALSTRDVYARFDEMGLGFDSALAPAAEPDWDAWAALPARELLGRLVNDLEPAAYSISPDLLALRARLEDAVGRVVRMSGSGSSLFTLFDAGEESVTRAAARAGGELGLAAAAVDVTPGVGPVAVR